LKSILILSSRLRQGFPGGIFPLLFPPPNLVCISLVSHTCYMLRPPHYSNIWPNSHVTFPIMQVLIAGVCSSLLDPPFISSTLLSNWCRYLTVRDQVSHLCKATGKIILLYILLASAGQVNDSGANSSKRSLHLPVFSLFVRRRNSGRSKFWSLRYEARFKSQKYFVLWIHNWSPSLLPENVKIKITWSVTLSVGWCGC
jgi:hypothetical protein